MNPTLRLALNFAGFQSSWAGAIILAAAGRPWLGAACLSLNIGLQVAVSTNRPILLKILAPGVLVGPAADALLAALGVFSFPAAPSIGLTFITFFAALWAGFGTTLPVSMMFLVRRPLLGLPLGAGGGVLAYAAAERLGSITLGYGLWPYAAIAGEFGLLTALWCGHARRVLGAAAPGTGASQQTSRKLTDDAA